MAHLSGAKFFPPFDDADSEVGNPAVDPKKEAIDETIAEIDRIRMVIKYTDGHEPVGCPFLKGQKEQLQEMEGQLANLRQDRRAEVPIQMQLDRKNRAIKELDAKLAKTKLRKAATWAALQAAQSEYEEAGNILLNQKARFAKLHREVDALHAEHIPFEEAISSCVDEEELKQAPAQAARARGQSPKASQASQAQADDKDTRVAIVGEPRAKRPCTKGDGKGNGKGDGKMSDDGDGFDSDTP
jgi:DNA repair exonuclease SbcCD ATPase subunit